MQIYKFYKFYRDKDNSLIKCDIAGEAYKHLIEVSAKYSSILSLCYYGNGAPLKKKLKKFETMMPTNISFVEYHNHGGKLVYYTVCPELCEVLIASANGMFDEWVQNWQSEGPDNLTFYRDDGSVFLNTVTHDNVITLRPRDDEDIEDIISRGRWLTHDNDNKSYKIEYLTNYVPDEKTATAIAKSIFRGIKYPYKRELKWAETKYDSLSNKWIVIFARRDFACSICKIIIDKETAYTEIRYETI